MCKLCLGVLCLCNGCVAWDKPCPRCHHFRVMYPSGLLRPVSRRVVSVGVD